MRADVYLYTNGLAKSRNEAKQLIEEGLVLCDNKVLKKPSFDVLQNMNVEVIGQLHPYVSRGGLKLEGALKSFSLNVEGCVCVDVGASTGGFTDCLLINGASKVFSVDCGTGQLAKKLLDDPRVVSIENFNARLLNPDVISEPCDIAVMDVSFISQTHIHNALASVMKPNGYFVSLIKPQFEAGRSAIGKKGIVKDRKARLAAIETVCQSCAANGFELIDITISPITGGDGNTEYISLFKFTCEKEITFNKTLISRLN